MNQQAGLLAQILPMLSAQRSMTGLPGFWGQPGLINQMQSGALFKNGLLGQIFPQMFNQQPGLPLNLAPPQAPMGPAPGQMTGMW